MTMDTVPARRPVAYLSGDVLSRLMKVADAAVLSFGAAIITVISVDADADRLSAPLSGYLALVIGFLSVVVMRGLKLYRLGDLLSGGTAILHAAGAVTVTGLIVFLIAGQTLLDLSPAWLFWWPVLSITHAAVTRGTACLWARPQAALGRFRQRIAIVGGGDAAENVIDLLNASEGLDIEIVGLFDDRYDSRSPDTVQRHRKIGKMSELAEFARAQRIDLIIVAIPLSAEARLLHILKKLWELPVDIRISGEASSLKFSPRAYTNLGKLPLLSVFDRPLSSWGMLVKSAVDRVIAAIAILCLSPVLLATALAVKLESKGPVIFRQRRYGFNNELVEIYKFRSMYVDQSDATASRLVTKGDPRVTRIGRIIRKTSIDELPQLFNVLTGQLSLVGPRPHATQAKAADTLYEQVVEGYFARHRVKPGITGWAQINGWRGETDTREKLEQRVKHDLEYIDRWSIWFDLYIMLKTPAALLKTENAY